MKNVITENLFELPALDCSRTAFFLLMIFVAGLVGCASIGERTEKMLSEGRVDAALTLIEDARRQEPGDAEFLLLERKVRLQWISDKLIQVRLARLSDSKGQSEELMRKILSFENRWSLIPTGAVFATQAEEVSYLAASIQNGVYEAVKNNRPLEAAARFDRDRALMEDLLKIETDRLKRAVSESGRAFCRKETKALASSTFYSSHFLKSSCERFQTQVLGPKVRNSVQLFGKLSPTLRLTNAPAERLSEFSKDLRAEFEKSIWHDPRSSKSLSISLSGPLDEKIDARKVYRSKSYTVSVPYEETSVRKKEEKSGLGTLFEVLAWAFTTYKPDREVDNHDGTVTVYQTKYRNETRYFQYEATEVTQTLQIDWKIELKPDGHPHDFTFREQLRTVSDEHTISFPDADLAPAKRTLIRPADWLLSLNRTLMDRIGSEFNQAWIDQFCVPLKMADEAELHHRCIYGANGHVPSLTADWFRSRYGLEIETWRQLVTVSK